MNVLRPSVGRHCNNYDGKFPAIHIALEAITNKQKNTGFFTKSQGFTEAIGGPNFKYLYKETHVNTSTAGCLDHCGITEKEKIQMHIFTTNTPVVRSLTMNAVKNSAP